MSAHDLIYPGDLANFKVAGCVELFGATSLAPDGATPDFWAVYVRPATGDIAEWLWVADFSTEIHAREYAAWQAKRS